ncbi:MAG TPA: hypothetical protein VKX35_05105 [Fermentimonas sp.]|nr:hypothetical protein [Fermentimonas sp.]
MAYCKRFFYKRVWEAQILVRRLQKEHPGLPQTEIYRQHIKNEFHISKSTFDRWMGIPAARELEKIEKKGEDL